MVESMLLKWFSSLSKKSVGEAGGKGASLGEMTKAGIPVPNGYVILSASFEKFLEETDLNVEIDSILDSVNHKEMQSIENASEEIKALMMNAKMPKDIEKEIIISFKKLDSVFVAVRSSATSEDSSSAAWAGQLDSFLNTKSDTLLENVKRCWASLFTPRAIFYRFEKGLHDTKISVAVVVQKMVNSEISGIAFSVHPVTQDRNQFIIEAGLGLGEAIVSGQITPDSYVIEKVPRRIIDKNISEQERGLFKVETGGSEWKENLLRGKEQKLTDKQIMELAEIILGIEKHYGFPCDIEWAFENEKFFIVQSRPITTLTDKSNDKEMPSVVKGKESEKKEEIKITKKEVEGNDLAWAKNYLESNEFDIKEARIAIPVGEIFFPVYAKPNCFGDEYGPVFIPYSNQKGKQILQLEKYTALERHSWSEAIKNKKKFISTLKEATKIQKKIDSISINEDKLYKLNSKKLHSYFKELVKLSKEWWEYGSIAEDKGLVVEEKLVPLLMKNHPISKTLAFEYVSDMTAPLELSIFSKERMNFLDLCIKAKKDSKLIEKKNKKYFSDLNKYSKNYFYARTGFYEAFSLSEGNLVGLIKEVIEKNSIESLKGEYDKLANGIKHLKEKQKLHKKELTPNNEEKDYLWYFTHMHIWQDKRKVSMMKHFNYFENVLQEVSKRTSVDYDTISVMTLEEVEDLILGKKLNVNEIENRKEGVFFVYLKDKVLRFYGKEAQDLLSSIPSNVDSKEILKGAIACKGNGKRITGKVRIVHNPAKDIFNEGEVLVTTMTRPEFVPIMQKAKAIITDEGGLTSHAAIVSRELQTPCIIGTKVATQVLSDGDFVEVDPMKGIVIVIQKQNLICQKSDEEIVREEISKYNWAKWIQRPFQAFTGSLFEDSSRKESYEKIGVFGIDEVPQLFQSGCWYSSLEVMEKFDAQVKIYLLNHKMSELSNELIKFREKSEKDIGKISKSNIDPQDKFKELFEILKQCCTYVWITHGIEAYFSRKLNEEVPKYVKGDVEKFIGDASFPKKKNTSSILEDLMRSNTSSKKVAEKAGWVKVRDGFSDPFTENEIEEMRKQLKLKIKAPKVKIPKELKPLFKEVQELVFFRTERTDVFYYLYFKARPILNELAAKHNISFKEMQYCRAKSFLDGKIEKYYPVFSFATAQNKSFFQKELILDIEETYNSIIKGTVAFKGKVTGVVKIVKDTPDLPKVKEGDILVTQMTFPSFIPAMVKASAFVTDEGGITCHAAIVAREMQKPCIIGTKNATKVLKDGDFVEVDANKGIVTIINKKK